MAWTTCARYFLPEAVVDPPVPDAPLDVALGVEVGEEPELPESLPEPQAMSVETAATASVTAMRRVSFMMVSEGVGERSGRGCDCRFRELRRGGARDQRKHGDAGGDHERVV